MKRIEIIILLVLPFFLFTEKGFSQQNKVEDSLRAIVAQGKGDSIEIDALVFFGLLNNNIDSSLEYAQKALDQSKQIGYRKGEAGALLIFGLTSGNKENFAERIRYLIRALNIYEEVQYLPGVATVHLMLQGLYREARDFNNSLFHAFLGEKISNENNIVGVTIFSGHRLAPLFEAEIGQTYILKNFPDSAAFYTKKAIENNELFEGASWSFPYYLLATIQRMKGDYSAAINNYRFSKFLTVQNGVPRDTIQINSGMSSLFAKAGNPDSSIYYAYSTVNSWDQNSEYKNLQEALENLGSAYKMKGEKDSAIKYIELSHAVNDSIYSADRNKDLLNMAFNERMRKQELLAAERNYKSNIQKIALAMGILSMLIIAGLLFRNNRHKQLAYAILEKQKQETDLQKVKVEQTLEKLQATQSQLVQSEKMASLGELTAGIAHEIQNPLNFVNNFSEVNSELLGEMKKETEAGNLSEIKLLTENLEQNMSKITQHGKRADAIVKSMLQHSRASVGKKELIDINGLADEYLRLSYHGIRAKDKTLNATLKTDFDQSIGLINVIPQDIGRVLLNIFNNAFYALNDEVSVQAKIMRGADYKPIVSVTTKRSGENVEILVRDNGPGIPHKLIDKIFQPFFTTKPTGNGTGLGLSISYDIITAHGGAIKVDSKEGEGTEFIIQLPITFS